MRNTFAQGAFCRTDRFCITCFHFFEMIDCATFCHIRKKKLSKDEHMISMNVAGDTPYKNACLNQAILFLVELRDMHTHSCASHDRIQMYHMYHRHHQMQN